MELMPSGVLKTDVFVVGGGPAGLAAAIFARQRGLSVIVADSARPPIDKTCGEGLMPQTVTVLKELGVALGPAQAVPFCGIRFVGAGTSAGGTFLEGYGLGVRRTVLHQALVERAEAVGVRALWGSRVRGVKGQEVLLESSQVRCRWIIGADGQNSLLRRGAGLDGGRLAKARFGFRQHYRLAPWTDFVEVHWGRHSQIVVTPVSPEEVCLVATSRSSRLRLQDALAEFPALTRRLEGCPATTKVLGAISALRTIRQVYRGPYALVGDASGSVDSLTGEGLGLAFQQAKALADALVRNDLPSYQAAHRRINRPSEVMSRVLLAMENRPWLHRRALAVLAREPQLFERLLAIHTGTFSPLRFGLINALRLGRGLLANAGW